MVWSAVFACTLSPSPRYDILTRYDGRIVKISWNALVPRPIDCNIQYNLTTRKLCKPSRRLSSSTLSFQDVEKTTTHFGDKTLFGDVINSKITFVDSIIIQS